MAPVGKKEAYCTLLTTDQYVPGALVLAHSLLDNGTKKQLAAFVTLDTVSTGAVNDLRTVYDQIIPVKRFVNQSPANLYLMDRPDLHSAFTKIALWQQTQFDGLVYLDADIVALRAPDELFNIPSSFAAVPDIGWPDCFNSGVLCLKPNLGDYYALLALAQRGISFDGADQGLLNMHFRNWERLSFTYNCTPSGNYQYAPAYRHFQSSISLVHFIGKEKPWLAGRGRHTAGGIYNELVGRWWAVYDKHFREPEITNGHGLHEEYDSANTEAVPGPESTATTEASLSESGPEVGEKSVATPTEPPPAEPQRDFSIDWDPTREAPHPGSRPEAPNFPQQQYQMSQDRALFQAPPPPMPPKELHYEQPKAPLKPIFPWETQPRAPTRVFAEDFAPTPTPESSSSLSKDEKAAAESSANAIPATATPSPQVQAPPSPFSSFTTTNAWDNDPSISRYVSSLPQNRRSKFHAVLSQTTPALISPPLPEPKHERRPSRITDFPTEIERPSLPVTPAPVHRPSFWGAERDESGALPAAEGVPEQSDWDPVSRLQELHRRQTVMLEQGKEGEPRPIPHRDSVSSAAVLPAPQVPTRTTSVPKKQEDSGESSAQPTSETQKTTFSPLETRESPGEIDQTTSTTTQKSNFTPLAATRPSDPPTSSAQTIVEKLQQESAATAPPSFIAEGVS